MVQGFFCYQVIDPCQMSKDFSAPVISATLCYLEQACLQFICSQIIRHSIFFSSIFRLMFVQMSRLVAKNAFILVRKLNRLCICRTACSWCTDLSANASLLQLYWLSFCIWCLRWFLGDLDKCVLQIIFTYFVVAKFSFIFILLHTFHNCNINSFCIFNRGGVTSSSIVLQLKYRFHI